MPPTTKQHKKLHKIPMVKAKPRAKPRAKTRTINVNPKIVIF